MKKLLTILVIVMLPLLSVGQETTTTPNIRTEAVIKQKTEIQKVNKSTSTNSAVKSQLLKINKKKSQDIISIKAYRKSLQIKVKDIKLC
ncbi:hypothetical protein [Psychroserpens sp.]|uniref:hypothetical protein n=1 Tax=Psychroserpens sp. TaxID=2020870 RepID=UPI001B0CA6BD|nr:hypothetical protein [Psychroserpens sp.]MBO6607805.1 hypothetical protein [Psychroserpens sp.]MBO6631525.1 hypothetical protein [Psychroserpens sp.]MBO6654796.1 hypothetical protein [Psychroserpens sp.]MBO6682780.1 hypothetical protein [Psychroserpens sp.]MBO6751163.1 hypothetical protein [Psychroserpens sp.]